MDFSVMILNNDRIANVTFKWWYNINVESYIYDNITYSNYLFQYKIRILKFDSCLVTNYILYEFILYFVIRMSMLIYF